MSGMPVVADRLARFVETPRLCSRCHVEPKLPYSHSWWRDCRNEHSRENRPRHSQLTKLEREKSSARAYANVYQRRGLIEPKPCEVCGEAAEKHHQDYGKPLDVRWLCRIHHVEHHRL